MRHPFRFNSAKSIEAILYIAQHVKQPTFHRISKIMYFADKQHLEKYGRFLCGDYYVAMKHGPVPSSTYDLLKAARNGTANLTNKAFIVVEQFLVKPLQSAQLDYFSESDLECLDDAIAQYGHLSFSQLTQLSHDQAWHTTDENDYISIEQIVSTLASPEILLDYLQNLCPE